MKVISPLMHVVSRIISPFYPPLLLKEPALCPLVLPKCLNVCVSTLAVKKNQMITNSLRIVVCLGPGRPRARVFLFLLLYRRSANLVPIRPA